MEIVHSTQSPRVFKIRNAPKLPSANKKASSVPRSQTRSTNSRENVTPYRSLLPPPELQSAKKINARSVPRSQKGDSNLSTIVTPNFIFRPNPVAQTLTSALRNGPKTNGSRNKTQRVYKKIITELERLYEFVELIQECSRKQVMCLETRENNVTFCSSIGEYLNALLKRINDMIEPWAKTKTLNNKKICDNSSTKNMKISKSDFNRNADKVKTYIIEIIKGLKKYTDNIQQFFEDFKRTCTELSEDSSVQDRLIKLELKMTKLFPNFSRLKSYNIFLQGYYDSLVVSLERMLKSFFLKVKQVNKRKHSPIFLKVTRVNRTGRGSTNTKQLTVENF